jgi:hypothetical protein
MQNVNTSSSANTSSKGLKLIGKGAFSKCYQLDVNTVLIKSVCPIKECMALGYFPDSPLFPTIDRLEYGDTSTYKMAYYPKTASLKKALDADQYAIYKELLELFNTPIRIDLSKKTRYDSWREAFNKLSADLASVMLEALDACADYSSDVCFEISPRNVAVKNGKLVLMDCFFMMDKLQEIQAEKAAKRQAKNGLSGWF